MLSITMKLETRHLPAHLPGLETCCCYGVLPRIWFPWCQHRWQTACFVTIWHAQFAEIRSRPSRLWKYCISVFLHLTDVSWNLNKITNNFLSFLSYSIHSANATEIWELVSSTELSSVQESLATSSGHRGLIKCVNAINGGRSSSSNTRIIRNVPEGKSLLIFLIWSTTIKGSVYWEQF